VYSSREIFEQGLVDDGRVSPVRAAELSDFALGVGKRRQLLLHQEPNVGSAEWVRLVAHELRRGSYRQVADVCADQVFPATRPFPVEVVPAELVAGPWQG